MNFPACYTPAQMDEIQQYIIDNFGGGNEGMIGHELDSQYVHTDVMAMTDQDGDRCFVTFGMGARKTNAPIERLCRTELLMYATSEIALTDKEAMIIMGELQRLSKFPFLNETFFGPGHTVDTSAEYHQTFGFDAFVLMPVNLTVFDDLGDVLFLLAVPIYRQEREKMIETDSFEVLDQIEEAFAGIFHFANSRRCVLPIL